MERKEGIERDRYGRNLVKGIRGLAAILGVHYVTVAKWRKEGILDPATVADFRKTIIFDVDKALECLHNRPARQGRQVTIKFGIQ